MDETWTREFTYTCTEEEIYLCLKPQRAAQGWAGAGGGADRILLLLTIYCLIGFFADGMTDWRALGVAVIAVTLIVVLLLVPEKRFRHDAAREAELNRQLHVFLYDEGLAFGTPDDILPFSACRPRLYADMAVLRFAYGAVMAVPKRAMTQGGLAALYQPPVPIGGGLWKPTRKGVTSMPQETPPRLEFSVDVTEKEYVEASLIAARRIGSLRLTPVIILAAAAISVAGSAVLFLVCVAAAAHYAVRDRAAAGRRLFCHGAGQYPPAGSPGLSNV